MQELKITKEQVSQIRSDCEIEILQKIEMILLKIKRVMET